MRHGKHNVEVLAKKESGLLLRQPTFYRDETALRTKTMPARVPPSPFIMPVGADLLMPTQRRCTALQYPFCCYLYTNGQGTGSLHRVDACLNDRRDYHDALSLR